MVFKVDFILGDIEDLLRITNKKLENIEKLLEFIMIPPDLVKYHNWKGDVNDIPRENISDEEK
tara:strand:+ start:1209 stop:1397 length:189 start_codon:yes stop_codon:yes gene_type:complete